MKSSGSPSAEVNASIVPPRIRFNPSGVPTHRSPFGAAASDRITSLASPFRTEYVFTVPAPAPALRTAFNPPPLVPTHSVPASSSTTVVVASEESPSRAPSVRKR